MNSVVKNCKMFQMVGFCMRSHPMLQNPVQQIFPLGHGTCETTRSDGKAYQNKFNQYKQQAKYGTKLYAHYVNVMNVNGCINERCTTCKGFKI